MFALSAMSNHSWIEFRNLIHSFITVTNVYLTFRSRLIFIELENGFDFIIKVLCLTKDLNFYWFWYRYSVTFRAENGGYRIVNNVGKQYYVGKPSTRRIDLKFDTETPYHCSEKSNVACISSSSTMMTIQNDVTKVLSKLSHRGSWQMCYYR